MSKMAIMGPVPDWERAMDDQSSEIEDIIVQSLNGDAIG
jgi:hypothetical protein